MVGKERKMKRGTKMKVPLALEEVSCMMNRGSQMFIKSKKFKRRG